MQEEQQELKQFLRHSMYEHPHVAKMTNDARMTIKKLFDYYIGNLEAIPEKFRVKRSDEPTRVVADYIAGMTDRFAIQTASTL